MNYCCVSVDVDGIDHYCAIHGLSPLDAATSGLSHGLAVERLLAWAEEARVSLTWFVIGRDTSNADFVRLLKGALGAGHELANHSLDHRYDLARLDTEAQTMQVAGSQERLVQTFGIRPLGFRAPGYTVSDALFEILEHVGFAYDSSVFPCPVYYAAKALILLGQRTLGRHSKSMLDTPRILTAPTKPYRRGRPYTKRGQGLLEIPIQVTPLWRLPFIGTTLTSLGPSGARRLARSLVGEPIVNLELHAIDLLTADDGLQELARHQPDLKLPLARKLGALSAVVDVFRTAGYAFVTMAEAAASLDG